MCLRHRVRNQREVTVESVAAAAAAAAVVAAGVDPVAATDLAANIKTVIWSKK